MLRRVTLPLLLPAALAAALLVMVQSLGIFSVPAVLGMPAGFAVATTQIYQLLENYPPRIGDATAWGVLLLAIAALLTSGAIGVAAHRSFATITGKALRPSAKPPRGAVAARLFALVYVALATSAADRGLLWAASVAFVTANVSLMRFTAQHFVYVLFAYPKTWLAVGNSVLLGVLTATPGLPARPGA